MMEALSAMLRGIVTLLLFLAGAAFGIERLVAARREAGWRRLAAEVAAEAGSGGLEELLRARIAGLRVSLAEPGALDVRADLAFVTAALAHDYGVVLGPRAEDLLRELGRGALSPAGAAAAAGAQALLALARGEIAAGETLARQAVAADRDDVRAVLVLARARALAGDPAAASQLAEAAAIKAPGMAAPLLAWAEARLDLGQADAALTALGDVVAREPRHTRARLLVAEAETALGRPAPADLPAACERDRAAAPVLAAACAAHAAIVARRAGDRDKARAAAEAAAKDGSPRTRAHAAIVLAQLGRIDQAEAVAGRVRAEARMPALAWARVAVALGKGEAPARVPAVRPAHPAVALTAARAAFARAGKGALARVLGELGAGAIASDPDLRAWQALAANAAADDAGPVGAYVNGLRARLAGDHAAAAAALGRALADHGDACRAAGEYLVVMRLLRRPLARELAPLATHAKGCINLTLPPAPGKPGR